MKIVAYIRVSTQRQGMSGLGLEAQQDAIRNHLSSTGAAMVGEYIEVETGKGANAINKRPQLAAALAHAKSEKATLVVAKLDRLARNVLFIATLMESGVKFRALDLPEANEFTIHLMAAFGQFEAKRISERTKDALKAAKARGVKLGITGAANIAAANAAMVAGADEFAASMAGQVRAMQAAGMTQRHMVKHLNELGVKTSRGNAWSLAGVNALLKRVAAL
ncbi:recombinase family protein [Paraburkholderia hospita]|nr:recombinase family protein [Paraburkholderia hospita]